MGHRSFSVLKVPAAGSGVPRRCPVRRGPPHATGRASARPCRYCAGRPCRSPGVVADILPPISTTQRRSREQSQRRSSRSASSAPDPTRSVKPCRTAAPRPFSLTSTSLSVRFPPDVPSAASSVWNHGERGARRCAGERCGRDGKISPAQVRALRGRTARSLSGLRRTLSRSARPRRTAEPRHAKFIAPLAERTYSAGLFA